MQNKKELKYIILIVLIAVLYVIASILCPSYISVASTVITTTTALIAAVAFWLQLRRTKNLDEANFIMSLNDQFISNDEMTRIEHALESYYNKYVDGHRNIKLDLVLDRNHDDCQRLINYLVYMEGLSALIQQEVMHLGVIDDLFAYRFFIAVNNPIVQEFELLPYANYYQGCFKLAEMWTNKWRKEKREIPLDEYSLSDSIKVQKDMISIRYADANDNLYNLAKCLYLTDPYIYPAAFGNEPKTAEKAIAELFRIKDSLFDANNCLVAFYNNVLCGVLLFNKDGSDWNTTNTLNAVQDIIPDADSYIYTSEHYFFPVSQAPLSGTIDIVACCVLPEFRKKGIAGKLLNWLFDEFPDHSISLDVLSDNSGAITLYKKHGFVIESEMKGFSIDESNRPDCYRMIRPNRQV